MLCLRTFPVANTSMDKKGSINIFRPENFCLTVPQRFAGKQLRAAF